MAREAPSAETEEGRSHTMRPRRRRGTRLRLCERFWTEGKFSSVSNRNYHLWVEKENHPMYSTFFSRQDRGEIGF